MGIVAIHFEERKFLHQVNLANAHSPRYTSIDQLDKFIREEAIRLAKVDKETRHTLLYHTRCTIPPLAFLFFYLALQALGFDLLCSAIVSEETLKLKRHEATKEFITV